VRAKKVLDLVNKSAGPHGYLDIRWFLSAIDSASTCCGRAGPGSPAGLLARAARASATRHSPVFCWQVKLQGRGVLNDMKCHSRFLGSIS